MATTQLSLAAIPGKRYSFVAKSQFTDAERDEIRAICRKEIWIHKILDHYN